MKKSFGKHSLLLFVSIICLLAITICGFSLFTQNKGYAENQIVYASEENSVQPSDPTPVGAEVGVEYYFPIVGELIPGTLYDYSIDLRKIFNDAKFEKLNKKIQDVEKKSKQNSSKNLNSLSRNPKIFEYKSINSEAENSNKEQLILCENKSFIYLNISYEDYWQFRIFFIT